jgi:hypothetical protein
MDRIVQEAELTGGIIVPSIFATAYGAYLLFVEGSQDWEGLVLTLGGIISVLSIHPYTNVIKSEARRSWSSSLAAVSVMVPYALSLFLMGYLGVFGVWRAIANNEGAWSLFAAAFWLLVGWRLLYMIGKLQRTLGRHSDYRLS